MGTDQSSTADQELIDSFKKQQPLFDFQSYIDNEAGISLQDVMSIRQCFNSMRDELSDPPEMAKVRRLRRFPFLTNEEILSFGNQNNNDQEDGDVLRGSVNIPEIQNVD